MGPLPETSQGNKHILVVVDHFTKWCEAFATPDQKASTVAPLLISRIFSRFGSPAVLHSDQGRNFESVLMHEICDSMGKTRPEQRLIILSVTVEQNDKTEHFRACCHLLLQVEEMFGIYGYR